MKLREQGWKPLPKSYLRNVGLLYGEGVAPSQPEVKPRPKAAKPKPPSEEIEQQAFIKWAHTHPLIRDLVFHIPNGGRRNRLEGAKLKRMGVRAGVSDLFIPYPAHGRHGLWIELKSASGSLSAAQQEWLVKMRALGYGAEVAHGWEGAKAAVERYLGAL